MYYRIIFYIALLNCVFLLEWYNFFWKFYWNRDFLLCTRISIDFNSQISFPLCWGVGVGNRKFWKGRKFWKVGVGAGYFTSDCATLNEMPMYPRFPNFSAWKKLRLILRVVKPMIIFSFVFIFSLAFFCFLPFYLGGHLLKGIFSTQSTHCSRFVKARTTLGKYRWPTKVFSFTAIKCFHKIIPSHKETGS